MGSMDPGLSDSPGIPLPVAGKTFFPLAPGMALIEPLSRRGKGPGLLVLTNDNDASGTIAIKNGFPSPALKWAEEGYAVVEIRGDALGGRIAKDPIQLALESLKVCDACEPKDNIGVVVYDPVILKELSQSLKNQASIKGYVIYDDASNFASPSTKTGETVSETPIVYHLAGKADQKLPRTPQMTAYEYPSSSSHKFATPFVSESFHPANEAVSHTRSLTFLKKLMDGPYFDLEAIWDEHTYYEFGDRSVENTMATMVQEPYVNHIPTMTGGVGRERLTQFYRHHFIFNNPDGTELELVSRTVGIDRIVDEFVFKFDHNKVIDWLIPGIPPTYKRAEIPFTAVVNVRGDRLYHEHIAWDQANALRQLGLLPEYLPFPYPIPSSSSSSSSTSTTSSKPAQPEQPTKQFADKGEISNKKWEYRVPVAGIEAADKLRDKNRGESNLMFDYQIRERKE